MTGIYYLWDPPLVLYIGSSRNIAQRISCHIHKQDIIFADFFVDQLPDSCTDAELHAAESAAILKFKPCLNQQAVC
jgi:hypothetical protein